MISSNYLHVLVYACDDNLAHTLAQFDNDSLANISIIWRWQSC